MLGLLRRANTFRSMGWAERRRYYGIKMTNTVRSLWHAPILLLYYPFALILARRNLRIIGSRRGLPRIGHLAWELHFYVKAQRLGIWGPERPIVLGSGDLVANTCLRDYWRDHLTVISNPILTFFMRPFGWAGPMRRNLYPPDVFLRSSEGDVLPGLFAYDHVHVRYAEEVGSQPLLEIRRSHSDLGRDMLHGLGMPRDAWFVALHVREAGYLGPNEVPQARDGKMNDYMGAIELITSRGGWVVRLGNTTMTPLPPMDNVIDYVFCDVRSPEMDIYLLAECRFFLGTDSGPVEVPPLFGKPCAISGSVPIGLGSHYADDIYMPNTYWSENESRLLSFPEAQGSEIRDYISNAEFAAANLKVIGPAAEHITALTQEIMDRLDGTAVYDDLDRQLKERWRELLFSRVTPLTRGQLSSVSRDFLRRNKQLLDDNREAS